MPRPCCHDHPLSPPTCRLCFWCADSSEMGELHRRLWDEPEPGDGLYTPAAREIVPGLLDPIPEDYFQSMPNRWLSDPRVIRRHREALLHLARAEMPDPGERSGTGVLLIGGGKYWPGAVIAVKMLRDTGCTLPIQIWYRGDRESVRPEDLDGLLGVEIRDLTALQPVPRVLRGWESKTVALLATGWERVFYLDADAYLLIDPASILDRLSVEEPFLFWEDHAPARNAVKWSVWGLETSPVPPVQGGHFAVHVELFWREIVLAHWLNQHSDFSYFHQFGDQDSWRIALTVTGGSYGDLGLAKWEDLAFVCEFDGRPSIVHRCGSKMLLPEDVLPEDRESNRRLDRLPGEARAWSHWEKLLSARPAAEVFGRVYASGNWGPGQISGGGSSPLEAEPYLDIVNGLVRLSGWQRVVDLGCGDGYVASRLEAPEVIGVDCYATHVERLHREMPEKTWLSMDLDRDRDRLPTGDVAFLKDVLHHWPNALVRDWLAWARQCGKWRWLICTQNHDPNDDGRDCPLGGYRGLDPAKETLGGLGLVPFCHYLYKSVLLLPVRPSADSVREL